jgi:hypothetical protein
MIAWEYDPPSRFAPAYQYFAKHGNCWLHIMRLADERAWSASVNDAYYETYISANGIRGRERAKAWCEAVVPLLEQARLMKRGKGR